jgi:hypothetical protein
MPGSSNDGAENPDKLRKGLFDNEDLEAKNAERFYQTNVTEIKAAKQSMKFLSIGNLAYGSIIGMEEAILTNSEYYTTTVTCKSTGDNDPAEVYQMDANEFKKKVAGTSASSSTTW